MSTLAKINWSMKLVLAFLNGNAQEMLPFGAAAILLNFFVLPRNPPREG